MIKYTYILICLIILVFLLQTTKIFDWELFAFTPSLAFNRSWTFITSIFLHADFEHLFFNMFALFIFGTFLESKIGSEKFLIIFFLSGIAGSIGYMLTASNPAIPAIGASGAVYGIIGTLAIVSPFMMVWFIGMVPMPMIAVAFIWGIMEFLGLFNPGSIAHGAHIFGLIIGVLFGFYLRQQENKKIRENLKF